MKQLIYTLFLSAFLMSSCTSGGVKVIKEDTEEVQVTFSSSITRATESEFKTGDAIGIYMLNTGKKIADVGGIYNSYANFKYSAVDAKNFTSAEDKYKMYFPVNADIHCDFVAYFPYNESATLAGDKVKIDVLNQDLATNSQLLSMYSDDAVDYNKTAENVSMKFRFMLSKVVITLEKGLAVSDDLLVGADLTVSNAPTNAFVSLNNMGFSDLDGKATPITGMKSDENKKIVCYMIPQGDHTGILFEIKDKIGNTYRYLIPDDHDFQPGMIYNYKLILNKTVVNGYATIEPWIPGEERNGNADQQ